MSETQQENQPDQPVQAPQTPETQPSEEPNQPTQTPDPTQVPVQPTPVPDPTPAPAEPSVNPEQPNQPTQPNQEPNPATTTPPAQAQTTMIKSNEELSDEEQDKLKRQLAEYQAIYRADMEAQAKMSSDKESMYQNSLEYFQKNTPMAAAQIVYLMEHSTSDSTRLNASKYVIECVRRGAVEDASNPVASILRDLMENPGARIPDPTIANG